MPAASGPAGGLEPEQRPAEVGPEKAVVRRLKTRREFLAVADARVKWSTPGVVVQARPRAAGAEPCADKSGANDSGEIRVGFTCSKKVGNAVARNRARRRLRAAAAQLVPQLGKPGTDYVLIGRRETIDRAYSDLLADLSMSLTRLAKPRPPRGATK